VFYISRVWQIRKLSRQNSITNLYCSRVLPEGVIAWILNILTFIPHTCYVHFEDLETVQSSKEQYFICGQVIKRAKNIVHNSQNSAKFRGV
jgi:phosphatidylinositol alpha-1,6-mannosyltransferase